MLIIKYESNIHLIDNYCYIKKTDTGNYIHLGKLDGGYFALEFKNIEIRDHFLSAIWKEMKNHTEFYDLDVELEKLKMIDKFNM